MNFSFLRFCFSPLTSCFIRVKFANKQYREKKEKEKKKKRPCSKLKTP